MLIVAEIANMLLAGNLLPEPEPHQHSFARSAEVYHDTFPSSQRQPSASLLRALQTSLMVDQPLAADHHKKLCAIEEGRLLLETAETMALRWWTELLGVYHGVDEEDPAMARRSSLFTLGGPAEEEQMELSVAVLVIFGTSSAGEADLPFLSTS